MGGGQFFFQVLEGGQIVFCSEGIGVVKMFCQSDSITKLKMHNLSLK